MGAVGSTSHSAHLKEQAIIKDQLSLNTSAMKSPNSARKNKLHVSFTTSEHDRPRVMNNYTRLPSKVEKPTSSPSGGAQVNGSLVKYNGESQLRFTHGHSRSNGFKDDVIDSSLPNGVQRYVPTHLPNTFNRSNNNHLSTSDNPVRRHSRSRYDSCDSGGFSPSRASNTNLSHISSSRRPRALSASPRKTGRIVIPGTLSRSDLENLKNAIRSAQSSSSINRKPSESSSGSGHRDRMTSFVIGRPTKFSHGAYGDMGIFKAISAVNDQLYICGVMALSEEKVKALKIDCVINATLEWPPFRIPGLETVRIQVDDVPSANLAPYFDRVADKLNEVISRGGKVLVHCMAGISRSCSLCIAYLMKHKGLSLQQAYGLMKARRPLVRPNDGFWRQLTKYEQELKKLRIRKPGDAAGGAGLSGAHRAERHPRSSTDNPSMTVTRLPSGQHVERSSGQMKASGSGQLFQGSASATDTRQRPVERRAYASLGALPATGSHTLPRNTSNHRLGTLRNSGPSLHAQREREIALNVMRTGDHWSTTYGNDYSKHFNRR